MSRFRLQRGISFIIGCSCLCYERLGEPMMAILLWFTCIFCSSELVSDAVHALGGGEVICLLRESNIHKLVRMKYDNDVLGEPIFILLGICLALRAFVSICWIIYIHTLLETNVKHAPSEHIFYLTFILKSRKKNPIKLARVCDITHTYYRNVHIYRHLLDQ